MPPFEYPPFTNPYLANMAQMLAAQGATRAQGVAQAGQAQAQGVLGAGQAYGNLFGQLGQIPTDIQNQQFRSAQLADIQSQIAERAARAAQQQRELQNQTDIGNFIQQHMGAPDETGAQLIDPALVAKGLRPEAVGPALETIGKLNSRQMERLQSLQNMQTHALDYQEKTNKQIGEMGYGIAQTWTPTAVKGGLAWADKMKLPIPDDLRNLMEGIPDDATPNDVKFVLHDPFSAYPTYTDALTKKALLDAQAEEAKGRAYAAAHPKMPDEERFHDILGRLVQLRSGLPGALPVSDIDRAWASAYSTDKEQTLDEQADRYAKRQQDAQKVIEARQEKEKYETGAQKLYQDYEKASSAARSLKELVLASPDNVTAANFAPLAGFINTVKTTGGGIRLSKGLVDKYTGPGSLFDQMQNAFSKGATGQPLTPQFRNQLLDLADKSLEDQFHDYEDTLGTAALNYHQPNAPPPQLRLDNPFPLGTTRALTLPNGQTMQLIYAQRKSHYDQGKGRYVEGNGPNDFYHTSFFPLTPTNP